MCKYSILLLSLLLQPAWAVDWADYRFFVAPMAGYSLGGDMKVTEREQDQGTKTDLGHLAIDESEHYLLMFGVETQDPGNVYLLLSRQSTAFADEDFGAPSGDQIDLDYYHLGGSLYLSDRPLKPYVTASLGVTRIVPDNSSSKSRFSLGIGFGFQYQILSNLALMADARSYLTAIDRTTETICDEIEPHSSCRRRIEDDTLIQAQANVGMMFRF